MADEASGGERSLQDSFRGALLGTFAGDALGAPFEGLSPGRMLREHGEVREMRSGRSGRGRYTDDTQMMIVVAEWLLEDGREDPGRLAQRLVEAYDPARGYGRGTTNVIRKLRAGEPWESAAEGVFPRGSFGNGAAIRVAPCALLLHHAPDALERLVEVSAIVTHAHPLGIAGAKLQARQVALAFESRGEEFDPVTFVVTLRSAIASAEYRQKLRTVEECLEKRASAETVRKRLGSNATALGSVPTALYCFLAH
ncbi:MAG: ADP-ribosylglycohydrolase family protein, partial [Candidatus Binatia bacterium]